MNKKLLAIVITVCMLFTSIPMISFAAEDGAVAKIGDNSYATLAEAVAAAEDGETIQFVADLNESIAIEEGKHIVLDLNGYTLTGLTQSGTATITNNGTLVIKDSTEAKEGMITRASTNDDCYYVILNEGTVTMESGNIYIANPRANYSSGASLVCNRGTFNFKDGHMEQKDFLVFKNEDGTFNMTGGSIKADKQEKTICFAVHNFAYANITGGTIDGAVSAYCRDANHDYKTVLGGDVVVNGSLVMPIQANEKDIYTGTEKFEITGGTFNVDEFIMDPTKYFYARGGNFNKFNIWEIEAEPGYTNLKKADGRTYVVSKDEIRELVTANKRALTLETGETYKFKLSFSDKFDYTVVPKYTSSNQAVATVTSEGLISAVAPGNTTITATIGGVAYTCKVEVFEVKALEEVTITGTPEYKETLRANVTPEDAEVLYRWYRVDEDGAKEIIDDAQSSRYTLTLEDVGHRIMVRAKGMGYDYEGTVYSEQTDVVVFNNAIDENQIELLKSSYEYTGSEMKPSVSELKDAYGKVLVAGKDYTISYENNENIGTATATVKGIGLYNFTKILTFDIVAKDLAATSKLSVILHGHDDITATWNKVTGATGYYVYYKKATSGTWSGPKYTTSTSYKLNDLADGVAYQVRVYPCIKDGTGTVYRDGSYKTSSRIYTLKKVTGVKAVRSGTKVKVSWSNISGESGYQISRSTKKTGTTVVKTYNTTSGKYTTVSATKGKTYYYKVRTFKTVGGKKIYAPWSTVVKYRR